MTQTIIDLLMKQCSLINNEVLDKKYWSKPTKVINRKTENGLELKNKQDITSNPILYRWMVKEDELGKLTDFHEAFKKAHETDIDLSAIFNQCKVERDGETYYALYFGKSKKGISRITREHLGNDMSKSTLRRSLCGLFVPDNEPKKEEKINKLLDGTYFEWLVLYKNDKEYIACLEAICIALGDYPLNIEGNPFLDNNPPEWRKLLTESRKANRKKNNH